MCAARWFRSQEHLDSGAETSFCYFFTFINVEVQRKFIRPSLWLVMVRVLEKYCSLIVRQCMKVYVWAEGEITLTFNGYGKFCKCNSNGPTHFSVRICLI
jgi:hypothetical protein